MMNRSVQLAASALVWVALALLSPAFGQTANSTITSVFSTQIGTINAIYIWPEETMGPNNIVIGTLTGCTLVGAPPYAGCVLGGGSGTQADPFGYSCSSPLPLTGCSGGTPFTVLSGTNNINVHTHTVIAAATTAVQPIPLGPWVPIVSAAGVLLAAWLLRRRRQTPG